MPDMNQNHNGPRRKAQPGGEREAPRPRSRKRRRRPIVLTILIRFFQIIGTLLLIGVVTGSFMICYAAVYVKTVVMPQTYLNLDEYILNENSIIYYEDKTTGEWRELQTLMGNENREIIEYKDLPEDLINAFIAIEDKRFPTHKGVDWRRTAAGLLYMMTGRSIQGGSTIDQQLIKNLTERDDVTVTRKILEIFTALELENNYKKETILTVYFNRIYMGNKCFGVQAAAQFYFGKDVWDLNLAECASLAGITNNPSLYAPYGQVDVVRYTCKECGDYYLNEKPDVCETCGAEHSFDNGVVWTNREYNKARQELILNEMAKDDISPDGAYITAAERDAAIAQPLVFTRDKQQAGDDLNQDQEQDTASSVTYSWYVEAVIKDAIEELMEARNINSEAATQLVFSGGMKIYVPYDPEVQAAVDTIYNDRSNLDQVSSKTGQRLMSAITVVDNSSGYVVALGNTLEKTGDRVLNPARDSTRQPGSSIKPLAVYSPAIEMGLITPATVFDDNPMLLNGSPWPINVFPTYRGLTTVLEGITRSLNTIAVRILDEVTPEKSYEFMTDVYGITSMEPYMVTSTGRVLSDIDRSPLAMGGLTHGVSTYEMAAAFATFPRNGEFNRATTILEITDSTGKTVVDNRNSSEFVIKPETAYYINSMLSNAVTSPNGTAGGAKISGQTVAGKTGTTNDVYNYWFCGYTSYYTAAVWTGYTYDERINSNYVNPSVSMWQKVMEIVHQSKNLENKAFDAPRDLVNYNICLDCGKLATADCANDSRGSRIQGFRLLSGDGPTDLCTCHVPVKVCTDSPILKADGSPTGLYHLAGEFCPEESVKEITMVDYQRELANSSVSVGDQYALLSFYDNLSDPNCDVHTTEPPPENSEDPDASDEPVITDPPPLFSDPFINNPTLPPTDEPTVPPVEPTIDPWFEPTYDIPYIPVGDPEQGY